MRDQNVRISKWEKDSDYFNHKQENGINFLVLLRTINELDEELKDFK